MEPYSAYSPSRPSRQAPRALLWWQLIRGHKPAGTLLLYWPCAWGVLAAAPSLSGHAGALLLLFVGAFAMRSAGCVFNDIIDRRIDAGVARTASRPLANGSVTLREAWLILGVMLLLGFGVWLLLPYDTRLLSLMTLPLVALYPFCKRFFVFPQIVLALVFASGLPVGWLATGAPLNTESWLLYAGCCCWIVGYDTVYAWQDRSDDRRLGVYSSALLIGRFPRLWIGSAYALFALCWLKAGYTSISLVCFLASIFLLSRWQPENSQTAARFFNENTLLGLLISMLLLI